MWAIKKAHTLNKLNEYKSEVEAEADLKKKNVLFKHLSIH